MGGMAAAATVALVVATPAWAAVSLTAPANGSRSKDATPTFSGVAAIGGSTSSTVTVKVYAGGTVSGSALRTVTTTRNASTGTYSVDLPTPALSDGTYTAQAEHFNGSATDLSPARTFTVDTTAPAVSIAAPANGSATSDTTPAANGSAGNATGDSSSIAIKIFAGTTTSGSPLQSFTVTKSGSAWSGVLGQLTPGTYTLQAAQADDLGNAALVTNTFTVDTAPPVVTLSSPADGSSGTDTAPTFSGTASEPGDVTVRVYSGGNLVRSLSATNFFGGWTMRASPALAAGTYTVQAAQTDAAGNTGTSAPRSFTVTTPALRLLTPFPIVRIVGRLTRTGAKLSLLSIRAPARATVEVRCRGRSCPFKRRVSRVGTRARTVKITRLVGPTLRAGVVIEVRISRAERIGKYTRFRIRRGKSPLRADSCVMPNDPDPVRCPS